MHSDQNRKSATQAKYTQALKYRTMHTEVFMVNVFCLQNYTFVNPDEPRERNNSSDCIYGAIYPLTHGDTFAVGYLNLNLVFLFDLRLAHLSRTLNKVREPLS